QLNSKIFNHVERILVEFASKSSPFRTLSADIFTQPGTTDVTRPTPRAEHINITAHPQWLITSCSLISFTTIFHCAKSVGNFHKKRPVSEQHCFYRGRSRSSVCQLL